VTGRAIHVLGAGPAGAAASLLLASWGHPVRLFAKTATAHPLAVSLPPSCGKLFEVLGVSDAVERRGFLRSTGNTVWWGSETARVESFGEPHRGWHVEVQQLSAVLMDRAVASGVAVVTSAPDDGGVMTIDCTGRAGVLAKAHDVREPVQGPRTIALVGEWRRDERWPIPDDTHTLIESYDAGWAWSVPIAAGRRHISTMIDPQRSQLHRGGSAKEVYLAEIRKTRVFRSLTETATLIDGPWGWDASPYHSRSYSGDNWLLAGDAGSFIDPLSSAGVKKALASAWLAAIVVNTCVTTPAMRSHALAFFSRREREIASHHDRESKRFLTHAASQHPYPFWAERVDAAPNDDATAIRRAFARLKESDALQSIKGPNARLEPAPCIRGRQIVLEPHLTGPLEGAPIRYVAGVDVVALVDLAPQEHSVPRLYETYCRVHGTTRLDDFLTALSTAFANGWLVSE